MKAKFSFIDPGAIMGVVVSLIILAIGVFAFFVTIQSIPEKAAPVAASTQGYNDTYNRTHNAIGNTSGTGNSVFNIIGIVLIIGAIMSIVGLVYNYVK